MTQASTEKYTTLATIRERLAAVGLTAETALIACFTQIKERGEIVRALDAADTNPRAKVYLQSLIDAAREKVAAGGTSPPAGGQPAQPPSPSPSPPPPSSPQRPVSSLPPPRPMGGSSVPSAIGASTVVMHGQPSRHVPSVAGRGAAPSQSAPASSPPSREPVPAPQSAPPVPPPLPDSRREGFHIYGGKAALKFEPGENRNQQAVVFVDAAAATGPKQYEWQNKLRLMLTPGETVQVLAVVLGFHKQVKFQNHGEQNDKWLEVQHQGKAIYFKVGQGATVFPVPIGPPDAFQLAALLTSQVRKNVPEGAGNDVQTLVRLVVAQMLVNASKPAAA